MRIASKVQTLNVYILDNLGKWDPNLHFCKHTTEFLDGCLNLLNAKACAK